MNIPISILKQVTPSTFAYHQACAKKILKLQNQKSLLASKQINTNTNQEKPQNPFVFQSKVFTWFFNQDLTTRLKLCSIQNKYLIQLLYQMKVISNKHIGSLYFRILYECKGEINLNQLDYTSFYKEKKQKFIRMARDELSETEELLFKEIRFISTNDLNDVMTLSHDLIQNEDLLKKIFFTLSNKECFREAIKAYQEQEDNKYYNFDFPSWVKSRCEFRLGEIVIMFFEQVLLVHYTHWVACNEIFSFPYYSQIQEIIDTSATLITFLSEASDKVALYNSIQYNAIRKAIKDDPVICEFIQMYHEPINMLFVKNKSLSEQIDATNMKLRSIFLQTHKFIQEITFITISNLFKVEDFVYKKIFEHLMGLYQEKNVNDLLNDVSVSCSSNNNNSNCNNNKKKKKKKKKKKDNKENKEEEDNNNNNNNKDDNNSFTNVKSVVGDESMPNHNVEEEKKEISNVIDIPLEKKQKEIKIKVKEEEKEVVIQEGEQEKEKEKNEELVCIKKRNFYYYPVNTSKGKKENKHHTNNNDVAYKKQIKSQTDTIISIDQPKESNKDTNSQTSMYNNDNNSNNAQQNQSELKQTISNVITIPSSETTNNELSSHNISIRPTHEITYQSSSSNIIQHSLPYDYLQYYPNTPTPSDIIYSSSLSSSSSSSNQFYFQLSKEIDEFASTVLYHKQLLNKTRKDTINLLTSIISDSLQTEYQFQIDFYGSYATDLSIESSDIDILIHYKPLDPFIQPKTQTILVHLAQKLIEQKDFLSKVDPILTASVPVIKLERNILESLDSATTESIRHSYAFNFKEIFTIKFDITFAIIDPIKEHPTMQVVRFIKEATLEYPQMKKVLFVLKRFMLSHKLNVYMFGGLSSFSLFLLLFAFIKIWKGNGISLCNGNGGGELLLDFLMFYSEFDFSHYSINVNLDNPYVHCSQGNSNPVTILDPFTLLNVAKSSFLISEVKYAFTKAIAFLYQYSFQEGSNQKYSMLNGLFLLGKTYDDNHNGKDYISVLNSIR